MTLNPQNLFYSVYNGFYYIGNGLAVASITEDTPLDVLTILQSVGFNPAALSDSQIDEIVVILGQAENAAWCVIDLNADPVTVTAIDGIPSQPVNHRYNVEEADGIWYLPVHTQAENAYYSFNPATGAASKAFDVVGGEVSRFINLGNNH